MTNLKQNQKGITNFITSTQGEDKLANEAIPAFINDYKNKHLSNLKKLAIPTSSKGNENWKHTNLNPIANTNFYNYSKSNINQSITLEELKKHMPIDDSWERLVFIDGNYNSRLSNSFDNGTDGITFKTVSSTISVENNLGESYKGTSDIFTEINSAFLNDGAFIQNPNQKSPKATQIVHISTNPCPPTASHPRTLILASPNSKSIILECHISLTDKTHLVNSVTEIILNENSHVTYYQLLNQNSEAYQINSTHVLQKSNSTFDSISIAKGASILRNELKIKLAGEHSECSLKGLYFTSGSEHIDNHIMIDHAVPKAKSEIFYKGILDDKSKAVFSGGVLVRENAQKTVAKQTDKNLLLSKGARINTKPMLEIYADDVECAHGATAGSIASEALFYMQSRGIGLDMARRLLINGFANQIIDDVQLESFKKYLQGNWLPN